jgi:hypothetical protein
MEGGEGERPSSKALAISASFFSCAAARAGAKATKAARRWLLALERCVRGVLGGVALGFVLKRKKLLASSVAFNSSITFLGLLNLGPAFAGFPENKLNIPPLTRVEGFY